MYQIIYIAILKVYVCIVLIAAFFHKNMYSNM